MRVDYWFNFDELKILGGFKNRVHVLGYRDEYDENLEPKLEVGVSYKGSDFPDHDPIECILSIDRKLFKKMLDKWLDEKLDYCNSNGYYCGVGGYIYCDAEKDYDTYINEYIEVEDNPINDGLKVVKKNIIVYNVKSFDELIDMEHG
jgi:hypothetical protein